MQQKNATWQLATNNNSTTLAACKIGVDVTFAIGGVFFFAHKAPAMPLRCGKKGRGAVISLMIWLLAQPTA